MEFQMFIQIVLLELVKAIVPVVVSAIVGFVVLKIQDVLKKLDTRTLQQLDWIVELAVKAAEQSGLNGAIANTAAEKRAYAIMVVTEFLHAHKLDYIDLNVIEAAIEAAILKGLQNATPDIKKTKKEE